MQNVQMRPRITREHTQHLYLFHLYFNICVNNRTNVKAPNLSVHIYIQCVCTPYGALGMPSSEW